MTFGAPGTGLRWTEYLPHRKSENVPHGPSEAGQDARRDDRPDFPSRLHRRARDYDRDRRHRPRVFIRLEIKKGLATREGDEAKVMRGRISKPRNFYETLLPGAIERA